jgi:WW domain-containing oxidoreductase
MTHLITGNKFDPTKDVPDLQGKARCLLTHGPQHDLTLEHQQTYVVTGGSAGIGFGIVAHLLEHKASKVYLLSNKTEHQDAANEELKKYGDVSNVELVQCNLASLAQTDRVAKDLKNRLHQLDALVCNAGVGVGKYEKTEDGLGKSQRSTR